MKILLFVSSRCPHCPSAESIVKKLAPEYYEHGLRFEKIRVKTGEGKRLAASFGVMSMPAILILDDDGNEIHRIVGVPSESGLKNKIESGLGLKKSFLDRVFGR